jgi:hypothetical protein
MKGLLSLIILFLLVSCKSVLTTENPCNLDSVDYSIYSMLLDKYVQPEIDSTMSFDEKNDKIIYVKNPRHSLLLIDSTKTFEKADKEQFKFLTSDSSLFKSFVERNISKCKLDSNFNSSIKMYKISRNSFDKYLSHDLDSGYTDIYKEYKEVTGIVEFSKIGYNADRTKALVEICLYRTPKNSFGLFIWLKFENGKWIVMGEKHDWIS